MGGRRNANARRQKLRYPIPDEVPLSLEGMARDLVERGLASKLILSPMPVPRAERIDHSNDLRRTR